MKQLMILVVVLFGLSLTPQQAEAGHRWFPGKRVARVIREHQPVRSFFRNRQPVRKVLRAANAVRPHPIRFLRGGKAFGV